MTTSASSASKVESWLVGKPEPRSQRRSTARNRAESSCYGTNSPLHGSEALGQARSNESTAASFLTLVFLLTPRILNRSMLKPSTDLA